MEKDEEGKVSTTQQACELMAYFFTAKQKGKQSQQFQWNATATKAKNGGKK